MEHQNSFPLAVTTNRRTRFSQAGSKEKLLDLGSRVDIDGSWYMSSVVLVIKSAVDNMEINNLIRELSTK